MDARVPAVVAVVVASNPGPWFDEVLGALAAQDYEELSVLVLVGPEEASETTRRVARALPDAFVRRLERQQGFGSAANHVLATVEGAAFFLLCHDDCAPEPDAVHLLVEEAYRSNAGLVSPKMVAWGDPEALLHVGMTADKTGALVDRVQRGEVDHGQHDAVRDVFVAPGGCTLVRADLFQALGGFDPVIGSMGEDLDLSWRAQVAGSRVVVAPDARVRHLEVLASGQRPPPPDAGEQRTAHGERSVEPTLQQLQRRHELRTVLKCYSAVSLLLVLPQALVLAAGEALASLVVGDRARARAVAGAWWWNARHWSEVRRRRREVHRQRALPDHEVRRLQLRGSVRLSTYFSRLAYQGLDVAHGLAPSLDERLAEGDAEIEPALTGSVGLAFSEDADFDDLDDLGRRRSGRNRFGGRLRRQQLDTGRTRLLLWLVAAAVLLVGTRDLIGGSLPLVGQYVPFFGWSTTWSHAVAAWQSPGVGSTAPTAPALALLGLSGTVLFGGMGLLQSVLVLGCIPVGAWGVAHLLRPMASKRARMVAAVSYLGLPLAYDALAKGSWEGLIAYATTPWILSRLVRASGLPASQPPNTAQSASWRTSLAGQALVLGAIEALAVAFAPAEAVVTLLCGLAIVIGSLVVGQWQGAWRALAVAAGATAVTVVLLFPWVIATVGAGDQALSVLGLSASGVHALSWTQLLSFAIGPLGLTALSWFLVGAALLPLLVGRHERLAWAGRLWVLACTSWFLALLVTRGWSGSFAPSVEVLLAPAATAVAGSVGLGVAAFENDLSRYHFGWRQVVTALAMLAAVLGVVPVVVGAGNGRWDLVKTGYGEPLSLVTSASRGGGGFRVLWLADPRALPGGGWSVQPGLAYATTDGGTPTLTDLWAPASPGPAATLANDVVLAEQGRSVDLGRLLAPAAVRYVVVISTLAPVTATQSSASFPLPPTLVPALQAQDDLRRVATGSQGFSIFENTAFIPQRAQRARPLATTAASAGRPEVPSQAAVAGWRPVLPGPPGSTSYQGRVRTGTVFASYAPAGQWHLQVAGRQVTQASAFGWAAQYRTTGGTATLSFSGSALVPVADVLMLLIWAGLVLVLLGRRRTLDRWRRPGLWTRRGSGRGGGGRGSGRAGNGERPEEAVAPPGPPDSPPQPLDVPLPPVEPVR